MHAAVDEGITFMDNCWDYHDGGAEERMGKALAEGGRRDKVFLMTKVCGRTARTESQPRGQPAPAQDRPHRPLAVPRDRLRQRPRLGLRRGRAIQAGLQGAEGRQGPLPRLHRPQGPAHPPQDARQALRLGHRPDAAERHGRPLPQLPEAGASRLPPAATSACIGMKSLGGGTAIVTQAPASPVEEPYATSCPCRSRPWSRRIDSRRSRPEPQDRPRVQADDRRGAHDARGARPSRWPATAGSSCSSRRRPSTARPSPAARLPSLIAPGIDPAPQDALRGAHGASVSQPLTTVTSGGGTWSGLRQSTKPSPRALMS